MIDFVPHYKYEYSPHEYLQASDPRTILCDLLFHSDFLSWVNNTIKTSFALRQSLCPMRTIALSQLLHTPSNFALRQ